MDGSRIRISIRKIGQVLEKVVFPFSKWISIIAMLAAVAMMFLVTTDVFMRRALNQPILGSYEISKIFLVIIVFFGAAYVMMVKGHVAVNTLTRLYPLKLQKVVSCIAYFLCLLIVGLICWQSAVYGINMLQVGETTVLLKILIGPFILIVAFGCVALFMVILVQFIYTLAGIDVDSDSPDYTC